MKQLLFIPILLLIGCSGLFQAGPFYDQCNSPDALYSVQYNKLSGNCEDIPITTIQSSATPKSTTDCQAIEVERSPNKCFAASKVKCIEGYYGIDVVVGYSFSDDGEKIVGYENINMYNLVDRSQICSGYYHLVGKRLD